VADAPIVVVGGALADVRATTGAAWVPGQSLPGRVRVIPGGSARNVAVNLARLGHRVTFLSAVGTDALGDWLLRVTAESGVDVGAVVRKPQPTGTYVTVGAEHGPPWCVADAGPLEDLLPADLEGWRAAMTSAALVVSDANLIDALQPLVAALAGGRPRALLATSPIKSVRLRPILAGASLLVCNRDEALALTGLPPTLGWQALGTALLVEGVERVIITRDREGVAVLFADEAIALPASPVTVVDSTGAGDAVAAVAIHAVLSGYDPERTAVLALAAAAAVVQSEENTPADLAAVLRI
jgi:pseudouridine kinase